MSQNKMPEFLITKKLLKVMSKKKEESQSQLAELKNWMLRWEWREKLPIPNQVLELLVSVVSLHSVRTWTNMLKREKRKRWRNSRSKKRTRNNWWKSLPKKDKKQPNWERKKKENELPKRRNKQHLKRRRQRKLNSKKQLSKRDLNKKLLKELKS